MKLELLEHPNQPQRSSIFPLIFFWASSFVLPNGTKHNARRSGSTCVSFTTAINMIKFFEDIHKLGIVFRVERTYIHLKSYESWFHFKDICEMKRAAPWVQSYTVSSDDSSYSDSKYGKKKLSSTNSGAKNGCFGSSEDVMSEGALLRRAEMYQDSGVHEAGPDPHEPGRPHPVHVVAGSGPVGEAALRAAAALPHQCLAEGLGSVEGRKRGRVSAVGFHHPSFEGRDSDLGQREVHRLTSSHHHLAKLWASDPIMYHALIDPVLASRDALITRSFFVFKKSTLLCILLVVGSTKDNLLTKSNG